MYCSCVNCKKMNDLGECLPYTEEGQAFRHRMGYCPITPPPTETVKAKVRVGQQKQRKKK